MDLASTSKNPVAASLAPGFRFHPTDEEIVWYYLKRKISGKPFRFDAISEIDVYKLEPWDLPGKSRLKTRDLEWYFFSYLDKKYGHSSRTNRATEKGYWKTTGKDRPVLHRSMTVGMKKTLVYHLGRAPRGERTNWVMHEYKLVGEEFEKDGKDACTLCRIFQKSGPGPKNGEQYGAPLVEEEWDVDDFDAVPKQEFAEFVVVGGDVYAGDDEYLDEHDVDQILNTEAPKAYSPVPEGSINNLIIDPAEYLEESQNVLVTADEMYANPVKREYMGESSNSTNQDHMQGEDFLDAPDIFQLNDGSFLETNDLSNHFDMDPSGFDMLDEYLTYFNADENFSPLLEDERHLSGQAALVEEPVDGKLKQETETSQGLVEGFNNDNHIAPTSEKLNPKTELVNGVAYPFMGQASRMSESIPSSVALAAEFPTKSSSSSFQKFNAGAAAPYSSPVRVNASLIQINANSITGYGSYYWSLEKQGNTNIILSFNLLLNQEKQNSASWQCLFYLLFIWLLIITMSFKIGGLHLFW
ncbi:NAC domain-containing protein 53-like isoform X2 [Impatiens glandulifera]|uniref:NAC domain-containing protein 53-like isoform X2 n=1 Tax=Impatiens glandulifera TaxID=253017 RepID=UPI001FB0CAFC|nr:NAC domain-containing protein 53-like isoform X2 [Impatiens glandulifera]